jgi:hypothetical protein
MARIASHLGDDVAALASRPYGLSTISVERDPAVVGAGAAAGAVAAGAGGGCGAPVMPQGRQVAPAREQYAEEPLRLQQRAGPWPTRQPGSSSTCCSGRKLLVVHSENRFIAMPSATRRPDASLAWTPLRAHLPDAVRAVGRCKRLQLGSIGLTQGTRRTYFANCGEPEQTPKRVAPRESGARLPQKVAGFAQTLKKVHRIRGGASSGNLESWKPSIVPVLYFRAPRRAMGAGKASSSGTSAAGHAFHRPSGTLAPAIWPVRRMRLEGLAGDAYDGSQVKGNIHWQGGHTKKRESGFHRRRVQGLNSASEPGERT